MIALSDYIHYGMHSVRFRAERCSYVRQQHAAWCSLKHAGGNIAVAALRDGFALAERYRTWDAWSLDHISIIWLAELAIRQQLTRIIEFGAGYSTLVLAEYLRQTQPEVKLISFEHQPDYARRIRSFIPEGSQVQIECADLCRVDDVTFEQIFLVNDPTSAFKTAATQVPPEHAHETRLHNAFYCYEFGKIAAGSVDLLILDGPNGNGRSLAFPFLRHAIRPSGWIFIDDYRDYPFLDHCQRVFNTKMVRHYERGGKEFALVQLPG